ncbi:MAG: ABC transporter permease [Gammaproteobacteria bacterium]|nr:ABC transporter permease [Gammaproteobacteria bacterium]
MPAVSYRVHRRIRSAFVFVLAFLVLAFLVAPIMIVAPLAFSPNSFMHYPLPGISLKWFQSALEPYPWMYALKNSVVVALSTTALATPLGTMAAYGLVSTDFRYKRALIAIILSPLAVPVVVIGLGSYFFFARVGLLGGYAPLIITHTVIAVPFVFATVLAALRGIDPELMRAAQSLGARPLRAFRDTVLPLIMPGVLAGAVFAFVTSFDDVVIAVFLSSPTTLTLPRQLFAGIRDQLDPTIIAVTVFLMAVSVALLIVVELLQKLSGRGGP